MTCTIAQLNILCYANGFTVWHYAATDRQNPAEPAFFATTTGMVENGDIIVISPAIAGGMPFIRLALEQNNKISTVPLAGVPVCQNKPNNQFLKLSGASSSSS